MDHDRQTVPTDRMENLLPSDIWRAKVLPYLDRLSRVDLNRLLEPETRAVEKMATEDCAYSAAIRTCIRQIDFIDKSMTILQKVKRTTRLIVFVQTPIGRTLLRTTGIKNALLLKIQQFESEYPPVWWKRSPYRRALKAEMDRLRILVT